MQYMILQFNWEPVSKPPWNIGLHQSISSYQLRNYLFEPDIDEDLLTDIIRRQISIHVPYVSLNQLTVENDVDKNSSYITITYSLINSETDTLTFNFQ